MPSFAGCMPGSFWCVHHGYICYHGYRDWHHLLLLSHLFSCILLSLFPSIPTFFCPQRFFHRPADGSEVMYDPVSVMNADILNYCQKESWCKLGFYLLSFFYYLYRWVSHFKGGFAPFLLLIVHTQKKIVVTFALQMITQCYTEKKNTLVISLF